MSSHRGGWAVAALLAAALAAGPAAAQPFQFAAIGDTGYSKKSEEEFSRMIAAMNKEPLAFVVHVGDFEADPRPYMRNPTTVTEPCTDESFKSVLAQFQQSAHPFVLTPGDNDWTDCHILKPRQGRSDRAAREAARDVLPAGREPRNADHAGREPGRAIRNSRSSARTSPGP